jgi:hypothetical protein
MTRPTLNHGKVFLWSVTGLILTKMWLTSAIRIEPALAPHDSLNYVSHAYAILAGAWFGAYSDMTLIKEPFYPIYLAVVQQIGLTLPFANLLLYATACVIACLAIRPIVRNGILLSVVFAALFFNPMTYASLAWLAMRSGVNDSLALLATACALGILVRRHAPLRALLKWWVGLAASFAAFWLTREEAIWLVPCVLVILAAYVLSIRKDPAFRWKVLALAIPLAFWYLSGAAIAKMNHHMYGWSVVVETKAPEFVSAYSSMARIVSDNNDIRIYVPKSSREIAYSVSPAARELEPSLEGPYGHNWINMVCKYSIHMCNDYAGSFFMWAFRDAVGAAGHYTSGAEARSFYLRLASEIDAACDSGRIKCRPKALTVFPNPTLAEAPEIWTNFRAGVQMATAFELFSLGHSIPLPNPALEDMYAFVVRSITLERHNLRGWLATAHPASITIESAAGDQQPIEGDLRQPSADVAAALAKNGRRTWHDSDVRFSITTACGDDCFIVATDAHNRKTRIPLSSATHDFSSSTVLYHLDAEDQPLQQYDYAGTQRALFSFDVFYHTVVPYFCIAGALMLLLRAARAAIRRRLTFPSAGDILSIGVMLSGGFLIFVLAALTVTFSAGFSPEYLGSFVPLMLLALSVAVAREGLVAYRFVRPRLRPLMKRFSKA